MADPTKKALKRLVIWVFSGDPLKEGYACTIFRQRARDIVTVGKSCAQQHVAKREISLQNTVFKVRTRKLRHDRLVLFEFCQPGAVVAQRH